MDDGRPVFRIYFECNLCDVIANSEGSADRTSISVGKDRRP